jgi:ADP-ribose pyrophosphatase YjhB (NUDIX family)
MSEREWVDEGLYKKFCESMPIASVDILAVYQGKLLIMLRNNEPGKNLWFLPGGRVRYGETLRQAVIRKLEDETGLKAEKIEKKGVMSHFWPKSHNISTFFRVDVSEDRVEMNQEHRDYKWISKRNSKFHPYLNHMIEKTGVFET